VPEIECGTGRIRPLSIASTGAHVALSHHLLSFLFIFDLRGGHETTGQRGVVTGVANMAAAEILEIGPTCNIYRAMAPVFRARRRRPVINHEYI